MLRKHRIPVSEALLCYEPATRTGGRFDQDTDGAGGRPGGTLLIFSNTLVFQVGPGLSMEGAHYMRMRRVRGGGRAGRRAGELLGGRTARRKHCQTI